MFRQLRDDFVTSGLIPAPPLASDQVLTGYRPSQLVDYLETFWEQPRLPAVPPNQYVNFLGDVLNLPEADRQAMGRAGGLDLPLPALRPAVWWHHLVYAYMLENTRVVDIFFKVVAEYASSEKLPPVTAATRRWLRVTEDLFFASPRSHSIRAVTSNVRPDPGAIRRNSFYRLLGMDLNHSNDDSRPYPFDKPEAANRDFAALFEQFLAEVWKAYMNRNNLVGANATDDAAILLLVQRIREMLNSRRYAGTLAREEFDAVATLSWFHLTLEHNTQIVVDLDAIASSPAERLKSIGARVGLPAHSRADAYFRIAEPVSHVLLDIENQTIEAVGVQDLYQDLGIYTPDMLTIITQWSIATGRDIKEAVRIRGAAAPVGGAQVRTGVSAASVSGNGGARRAGVPA